MKKMILSCVLALTYLSCLRNDNITATNSVVYNEQNEQPTNRSRIKKRSPLCESACEKNLGDDGRCLKHR